MAENASDDTVAMDQLMRTSEGLSSSSFMLISCLYRGTFSEFVQFEQS